VFDTFVRLLVVIIVFDVLLGWPRLLTYLVLEAKFCDELLFNRVKRGLQWHPTLVGCASVCDSFSSVAYYRLHEFGKRWLPEMHLS
jgi:hypothetical protein